MAWHRNRGTRRRRFLAALTTGFLLAGVAGAAADGGPAAPRSTGSDPGPGPGGGLGLSLDGLLGRALGATEQLAPAGLGRLRVPGDVRILVVSSGADKATFGDGYSGSLTVPGEP